MISSERGDRKYSKRIEFPTPVTGELTATYKHGVLEVRLKKAKQVERSGQR